MKIAFVLYNGVTYLDFFGFYDVVTRVKLLKIDESLSWKICAIDNKIKDAYNLCLIPDTTGESLDKFDMIFIPGGFSTRSLIYNEEFISWIKSAKKAPHKVSVCTGSLIFGAAGFLKNIKATTNKSAYELLKPYCKEVSKKRVEEDRDIISGNGVSSSIDVGLYVVEKFYGKEAKKKVCDSMDYML